MPGIEVKEGTPEFVQMAFLSNPLSKNGLLPRDILEIMGVIGPDILPEVLDEKISILREVLREMIYDGKVISLEFFDDSGEEIYFLIEILALLAPGETIH